MQEIIIIAAVSENNVIGKGNRIPWKIKEDLQRFKALTLGWPCIMGRKTYESLPLKPLTGRKNIIITRRLNSQYEDAFVFDSLSHAIDFCKNFNKIYICGGFRLYQEALLFANRIELTRIHKKVTGDVFFPLIDFSEWQICNKVEYTDFSFISYLRNTYSGNRMK